jgi:hypothetical protein
MKASGAANEFATALLEVIAAKAVLVNAEQNDEYYRGDDVGLEKDSYQRAVERLWKAVGGK